MDVSQIAIIQARTGSSRLPGKVLMEIAGKPIIHHVIDAVSAYKTVVAIPYGDDALATAIGDRAEVFFGPEKDVAERFLGVLYNWPCESFIRVCADSPMLTAKDVKAAINLYGDCDLAVYSGGSGRHVEVVNTNKFKEYKKHFGPEQCEHVTKFFYQNRQNFRVNEGFSDDCRNVAVDTMEDFDKVKGLMECERLLSDSESELNTLIVTEQQDLTSSPAIETVPA